MLKKKKIRYLVFGTLAAFIAIYLLDAWFESRYRNDNLYKTQWIFNKKNQQYDYVVLGASHSYVGFDMGVADSMSGMKGINISLDGSLIGTQSVLADVFFNRNKNTTKYLFFCLDNPDGLNTELLADIADGRMMPYLDYPEVFNFYKPYGIKWYFDRYVPFWKYAEYNYYWGPHAFTNTWMHFMKNDFDTVHGSRYDFGNRYDNTDTALDIVDYEEDTAEYKYFKKILEVCKQNNIKPILFTWPLGRADTSATAQQNVVNFTAYCKNLGYDFIYLGDYLNYDFNYFGTKGHLNKKGSELTTEKFMNIILQRGLIPAKTN
jgi:hypothetical protein